MPCEIKLVNSLGWNGSGEPRTAPQGHLQSRIGSATSRGWVIASVLALTTVGLEAQNLTGQALTAQDGPAPVVQPGAPGMASRRLPPSTTGQVPPMSKADVDFMQGMIMHHAQAVEMTAMIASHTENKAVRALGARISASQTDEMRFMKRWLVARGQSVSVAMPGMADMDKNGQPMQAMPGMLTAEQMKALSQAKDVQFDHLFLTGMIQHHNGALVMVRQLFDTAGAGQDADLFDFATDADNTQRAEIRIMQDMLKEKE